MNAAGVYALAGFALLLAVVLPHALRSVALSAPAVLLGVGALAGFLPLPDALMVDPVHDREAVQHLTEFTVLVALMGVGLSLDRPLSLRSWRSWRRWGTTWRLLLVAMPLTIAATAALGVVAGLAPASALLLAAVLAPTDPVLASDVQVDGPTTAQDEPDEIDESDEVRFALTSEAGLNDGLGFPFAHLAVLAAGGFALHDGIVWVGWDLLGRTGLGVVVGVASGWLLAKAAFRGLRPSMRTAETGEPLLALAAVMLSYGLAELIGGYGFLAVFACAMTIRSAERNDEYHALMHQVVQRLERLLTLVVLLLLGVALSGGLLGPLTWQAALVAVALVLVVRPVTAWVALKVGAPPKDRIGDHHLGPRERLATAFFGVRGVGSLFYMAWATGMATFSDTDVLWATVGLAITLSVVVHGVLATPAMRWLDARRAEASAD